MSNNLHSFGDKSTSITHIDYFDDTNTMEIRFTNGTVYHYPSCDKGHYEALKAASSPGGYFHKNCRKLPCKKQ